MFSWIKNLFGVSEAVAEQDVFQMSVSAHVGVVPLREMLQYAFSGEYIFHGSPVKLMPGRDVIHPKFNKYRDKCVYAGGIDAALRFALVRAWGINQQEGTDFYVFCTKRYRLVIYDANNMGGNWHNRDIVKNAYLYAIPSKGIQLDEINCSCKALPIVGRALVNQQELARAGFKFIPDRNCSTIRWWGVNNTDDVIRRRVLSAYSLVQKRQR